MSSQMLEGESRRFRIGSWTAAVKPIRMGDVARELFGPSSRCTPVATSFSTKSLCKPLYTCCTVFLLYTYTMLFSFSKLASVK